MQTISSETLYSMLGSFWSRFYKDDPFVKGILAAQLVLQTQVEINLTELLLSASREQIPIFHTEECYPLELSPSVREPGTDGAVSYPLPLSNVVSVSQIQDAPVDPSQTWSGLTDYRISDGRITFVVDPLVGEQRTLWMLHTLTDERWIEKHYGCLLGLYDKSSLAYRDLINSIFDARINGCSYADVLSIIAVLTGNAVARDHETVEAVYPYLIKTDENQYPVTASNTPCVSVGTVVAPGDPLTKVLNQSDRGVPGVLIPRHLLGSDYFGGLTFVNQPLPVFYQNGQIRFPIYGHPSDVDRYWQSFWTNCQQSGIDPAQVVSYAVVGGRVNPYLFLKEHANLPYIIQLDFTGYSTSATFDSVRLRDLLPPWVSLEVQMNTGLSVDIVPVSAPGDSADTIPSASVSVSSVPTMGMSMSCCTTAV